jgi:hypothetical protein
MSEASAYQTQNPVQDRCSLCNRRDEHLTFETRPTGRDGRLQTWPFCPSCQAQIEAEKLLALDPHRLAAFAGLLRTVLK